MVYTVADRAYAVEVKWIAWYVDRDREHLIIHTIETICKIAQGIIYPGAMSGQELIVTNRFEFFHALLIT